MPRWSTLERIEGDIRGALPRPRQRTFLPTFFVDRTEVTVEAYADYAEAAGVPLPPEQCGYEDVTQRVPNFPGPEYVPELSQPNVPERAQHPIVCVTRAEAVAYCAAQSGRLPTAAEWLKAGQPAAPDTSSYPWGESPPPVEFDVLWAGENHPAFRAEFAWTSDSDAYGAEVRTAPVGLRERGASPWGVLDLSGSVSEFLADCLEEVETRYPEGSDLRPAPSEVKESCDDAVLVAGTNWRFPRGAVEVGSALAVYTLRDGEDGIGGIGGDAFVVGVADPNSLTRYWGRARPLEGTPTAGPGNTRRSWKVGFRCVYDP